VTTVDKLNSRSTDCPHCGASLVGQEIPEKYRESFGGATHGSRVIGIECWGDDYISSWRCPDCGAEDSRF
jgi:rubredoxin